MTSNELEFIAECEHRSACARLVTLHAPMYTDDFEWCMCKECPYHSDRLGKNAKLRQQLADVTESMGRMEERCARLRELVKYTLLCCEKGWPCEECPLCGERGMSSDADGREITYTYTICNARDIAQSLGIEMDANEHY